MSFLSNLGSALRRIPLPMNTTPITGAGLAQGAGLSAVNATLNNLVSGPMGSSSYASQARAGDAPPEPVARPAPHTSPGSSSTAGHPSFRSSASPATSQAPGPLSSVPTPLAGAREGLQASPYRSALTRPGVLRAGQQHAKWRNPFVSAAMPAILQLQEHMAQGAVNQTTVRAQLVLEVRLFRERLSKGGYDSTQVNEASYVLCTYLDEVVSDNMRLAQQIPYEGDRSLLVEFHGDAWGGEDAFANLEYSMRQDHPPYDLLGLYEMLMALGLQGRYRMIERGDVLLQDLRSQLHAMLWQHPPLALGAVLPAAPAPRQRWWTPQRLGLAALGAMLLLYLVATFDLDARGRSIRQALAAWEPPTHTINPMETLPPPLPQLIAEGWLSAYKHPQGWLLVFRTDRAFAVGQAQFRPEFLHNLDRLGLALAPWPGDLEIIGHTDAQPIRSSRFQSNQALSEARAQVVAERMRQSVIPGGVQAPANTLARQLDASGRGETEPMDTAKNPAAFERNRRVDVLWKLLPKGSTRAQNDNTIINLPAPAQTP